MNIVFPASRWERPPETLTQGDNGLGRRSESSDRNLVRPDRWPLVVLTGKADVLHLVDLGDAEDKLEQVGTAQIT